MAISRQKEARSRDYSLPELSNESVLYGAQGALCRNPERKPYAASGTTSGELFT